MTIDIENKLLEKYQLAESQCFEEVEKQSDALLLSIAKCNSVHDQEQDYNKSNPLEKYYKLSSLAKNVAECSESLHDINIISEHDIELRESDGNDELLFNQLKESFGADVMMPMAAVDNQNIEYFDSASQVFVEMMKGGLDVFPMLEEQAKRLGRCFFYKDDTCPLKS